MRKYTLEELYHSADSRFGLGSTHVITERGLTGYAIRLIEALERAERLLDGGEADKAFLYSLRVFYVAGTRDILDDGEIFMTLEKFPVFWQKIFSAAEEPLKERMFTELCRYADERLSWDAQELINGFLFANFAVFPFVQRLLAFGEKKYDEEIVTGDVLYSFFAKILVPLRLQNGASPETVLEQLFGWFPSFSPELSSQLTILIDDPVLQYCILRNTICARMADSDEKKQYQDQLLLLKDLEEKVPEAYRSFLDFCDTTPGDVSAFDTWQAAFPAEHWKFLCGYWYHHLNDRRMDFARKSGNGILIADAAPGTSYPFYDGQPMPLKEVDALVPLLEAAYPLELFNLYYKALRARLHRSAPRSHYAQTADALYDLKDLRGSDIAIPLILDALLELGGGFPAFVEELEKRFPGCQRAHEQRFTLS